MNAIHDQHLRRKKWIIIESRRRFYNVRHYKISNRKSNWHEKHQILIFNWNSFTLSFWLPLTLFRMKFLIFLCRLDISRLVSKRFNVHSLNCSWIELIAILRKSDQAWFASLNALILSIGFDMPSIFFHYICNLRRFYSISFQS